MNQDRPDAKQAPSNNLEAFSAKFRGIRRSGGDLRLRLMAGFAVIAILPMIVAVFALVRIAEEGIGGSTAELAKVSRQTMAETSTTIVDLSKAQIDKTGRNLTDIGSKAVRDTTIALMTESETRFRQANDQLIGQGTATNQELTRQLAAQSQAATTELSGQLIRISRESNRELTQETQKLAEGAIVTLADSMVQTAQRNTNAVSAHIVNQNKEQAKRLSERMLKDIEREPVVNFKTLASIFARGIATNKVAPLRDGYLAVVDARGRVVASTKYKKGQLVTQLAIVKQALGGQVSEDSLLRFKDGADEYLGVFARREDGGAVVFAYLADRARVDTERTKADVNRTLTHMSNSSSEYVIAQLAADRQAMRRQAAALTGQAVSKLQATSKTLGDKTAARMQSEADKTSQAAVTEMTRRSEDLAKTASESMKKRSEEIATSALAAMRPIGKTYATKAEAAMRQQAETAIAETAQIVPQAADEASRKASARMAPEAQRLAETAKQKMWMVAGILVGVEVLLAILASLLLSGRIAAPILTAQQKAKEEQERLEREMEIASKIQTCLLPPVPELPAFDVAVSMVPAEEVGGDFVDLVAGDRDGEFWLGIGDVTGHGLTPGLIMMMAQSTFNAYARGTDASPKRVYDGMNRVLHQNIKDRLKTNDHMTMSVLKHEADGSFVHCGAHLDILVYRAAEDRVERVVTDGPWIGLLPDCSMFTAENRVELAPDDVMLLYTDGLIELQNNAMEQWDMDRLCDSLKAHARLEAQEIQAKVLFDALNWADRVLDDISMVVVKRLPVAAPATTVDAELVVPKARHAMVAIKGLRS